MEATVQTRPPGPLTEQAVNELRACRTFQLKVAAILDRFPEAREAVHSLRLSLTSLDDCIDALEPEEQPTRELRSHMDDVFAASDPLARDRLMDFQADADRCDDA